MPPVALCGSKLPPQLSILILLEPRLTAPCVGLIVTPFGRSNWNVVVPSRHCCPACDIETGPTAIERDRRDQADPGEGNSTLLAEAHLPTTFLSNALNRVRARHPIPRRP